MSFYKRASQILPETVVRAFERELNYASIRMDAEEFTGFLLLYSLSLSVGIALDFKLLLNLDFFLPFAFFFCLFFGGAYLWLSLSADSKGKFVDRILPDALQLIASNIKSGLTTERALIISARPEFGLLETELKKASREIMAGERIDVALLKIPQKIKSKTLEKIIWLISSGISSGGQIADLLIQLAEDIRQQAALEEEVNANISMYVVLIFFTAAFGAPVLFGASSFIVEVLAAQMTRISTPSAQITQMGGTTTMGGIAGPLGTGERTPIHPGFVVSFIITTLIVTSIFASMTMGVINTGKERGGTKFVPLILLITFIIFFIVRFVLFTLFGNLLL